jgi:hypothetical protein
LECGSLLPPCKAAIINTKAQKNIKLKAAICAESFAIRLGTRRQLAAALQRTAVLKT